MLLQGGRWYVRVVRQRIVLLTYHHQMIDNLQSENASLSKDLERITAFSQSLEQDKHSLKAEVQTLMKDLGNSRNANVST